ncbi:MAG: hypothetical protein CM1200mP26_15490 [Acidimicrobiales bacterium]|nr:MAG: hypothetical protein CM1200mP26_15490 [Acidimicrobiales bacterium]
MHPQTLASATMLLYIEGLFNLVRGQSLFLVGIFMFPAAWAIANDKRWGWRLGVGSAAVAISSASRGTAWVTRCRWLSPCCSP